MTNRTEKSVFRAGFTLVELLTVMAIIALLIGLLVPALGHVKTTAKVVQQKAQLKSIETALEAFNGMYGDYPPSNESSLAVNPGYTANVDITCGAQKLAEAVLGVDLRGYDPKSNFDRKTIEGDRYVYAVDAINSAIPADVTDSLARRKGPYVTVNENVGSFELGDLFASLTASRWTGKTMYGGGTPRSKFFGNVICDVFKVKNITYKSYDFTANNVVDVTAKVGTPILYYKADPTKKQLGNLTAGNQSTEADINASTYNWYDNRELVSLGRMMDQTKDHQWLVTGASAVQPGADAFYNFIQNPKIGATRWPHNPDSYILISAGPDGIYGNSDDITNFGSSEAK